jgi:hypothetical protein
MVVAIVAANPGQLVSRGEHSELTSVIPIFKKVTRFKI